MDHQPIDPTSADARAGASAALIVGGAVGLVLMVVATALLVLATVLVVGLSLAG